MALLIAFALLIGQQVYVTDTQNDPSLLGLATPWGRYLVQSDCVVSGTDVEVVRWDETEVETSDGCLIYPLNRMTETPCFTNEAGVCAIAAETD